MRIFGPNEVLPNPYFGIIPLLFGSSQKKAKTSSKKNG
jgi:hypothetical protein